MGLRRCWLKLSQRLPEAAEIWHRSASTSGCDIDSATFHRNSSMARPWETHREPNGNRIPAIEMDRVLLACSIVVQWKYTSSRIPMFNCDVSKHTRTTKSWYAESVVYSRMYLIVAQLEQCNN